MAKKRGELFVNAFDYATIAFASDADEIKQEAERNKMKTKDRFKKIEEEFKQYKIDKEVELNKIERETKIKITRLEDEINAIKEENAFRDGSVIVHVRLVNGNECYFGNDKIALPIYEVPKSYLVEGKILNVPVGYGESQAVVIKKASKRTIKQVPYVRKAW